MMAVVVKCGVERREKPNFDRLGERGWYEARREGVELYEVKTEGPECEVRRVVQSEMTPKMIRCLE